MLSFVVFLYCESEQGGLVDGRGGVGLYADTVLPHLGFRVANVDANPIPVGAVTKGNEMTRRNEDNVTLVRGSERGHPPGGLSLDLK